MTRALIVIDWSEKSGLGHVRRGAAIAEALGELGFEVRFGRIGATAAPFPRTGTLADKLEPIEPGMLSSARADFDVCVVDSYLIDSKTLDSLAPYAAIDDTYRAGDGADLIVNPAATADRDRYPDGPDLLIGPDYALVGSDVRAARASADPAGFPPRKVLVALGSAGDTALGEHVRAAVLKACPDSDVTHASAAAGNSDATGIAKQISEADLVITAGGVTALEIAALGRPAIALVLAPNQQANVDSLVSSGAMLASAPTESALGKVIELVAGNKALFESLAGAGPRFVDSEGASRVAEAIARLKLGRTRGTTVPRPEYESNRATQP